MKQRFIKRTGDYFLAAVDFSTWPINAGETVVASNTRGTLGVVVTDSAGNDVTATLIEGAPSIVGAAIVMFWLRAGTAVSAYEVLVRAPTSDGELLTELVTLEVLR